MALNLGFTLMELVNGGTYFFISLIILLLLILSWVWDFNLENRLGQYGHLTKTSIKYAFVMFLLTESMYFVALFWCLISNMLSPALIYWPPTFIEGKDTLIPVFGTVLLIGSSISATGSHHYYNSGNSRVSNILLLITILMGVSFVAFTGLEFYVNSYTISDSVYGSIVYMLLGTHLIHVILGILVLILSPSGMCREFAIYYWHYVDTVWLFVYALIYVWTDSKENLEDCFLLALPKVLLEVKKELEEKKAWKYIMNENRLYHPYYELEDKGVLKDFKPETKRICYAVLCLLVLQTFSCEKRGLINKKINQLLDTIKDDEQARKWINKARDYSEVVLELGEDWGKRGIGVQECYETLQSLISYPLKYFAHDLATEECNWVTLLHYAGFNKEIIEKLAKDIWVPHWIGDLKEAERFLDSLDLHPSCLFYKDKRQGQWKNYKGESVCSLEVPASDLDRLLFMNLSQVGIMGLEVKDTLKVIGGPYDLEMKKGFSINFLRERSNYQKIYYGWLNLDTKWEVVRYVHRSFLRVPFVYFLEERIGKKADQRILDLQKAETAKEVRRIFLSKVLRYGKDVIIEDNKIQILNPNAKPFEPITKDQAWKYCILILKGEELNTLIAILVLREKVHLFKESWGKVLTRYPRQSIPIFPGQKGFEEFPIAREIMLSRNEE